MRPEEALRAGVLLLLIIASGCAQGEAPPEKDAREAPEVSTLFTRLPSSYAGITFENRLTRSEDFNVFTYRNYFNGGGVGIGDLNGDGRPDVYLTSNQNDNKLYLNRGDFWFEDVTEAAGVAGSGGWSTGVSFADVNGDGLLDIYVCNAGFEDRANELFINQGTNENGVPVFEERAEEYGLAAEEGYSTHAAFFDYDGDGDLDMYLLNNSFRDVTSFGLRNTRHIRSDAGGDKLFRNVGGHFVDVSEEAGIYGSEIGFGLGVTVGDVNRDGWLDIYVSNDFFERDYLYINNGNGTFDEALTEQMRHVSLSSMGADMADLNHDGWPEIFVTDMLPAGEERLKTTSVFESWNVYQAKLENGYYHQFMRNMLHLNNRNGTFSEIGQIAGVAATDWSWGALIADFDLDGHKDIFVANGIYKDLTNQDFIDFFANEIQTAMVRGGSFESDRKYSRLLERIPSTPISNYLFRNNGDAASGAGHAVTFTDVTEEWGLAEPSFSNGAAYGDLDGDGDLDLVVNNVNQPVFVYRNEADSLLDNHYLKVRFEGEGENPYGLGAKVTVYENGRMYYYEQIPTRGFQSSVAPVLTIGVGRAEAVDSVRVRWPDGRVQVRTGVSTDQTLTFHQAEAAPVRAADPGWLPSPEPAPNRRFQDVTEQVGLDYIHEENTFNHFSREPLLLRMISTEGPALAVGDINGDGLDDLYLGGAKGQPGRLLVQQRDGSFMPTNEMLFAADEISEDVDAAFFDAEGDGDLDLYVVSGGSAFSGMAPALKDRLYLNTGGGAFKKASGRLPIRYTSGACVRVADYDGDGDRDLFVGSRAVPWKYGLAPESALLENDGRGHFTDVTAEVAPELAHIGLVTDASWADYDGDGRTDLIVVGEWMPITVFRNTGGHFERVTPPGLEKTHGWWNSLLARDFDDDGDVDFVAGNLGRNTALRADSLHPASLYVGDFDRNGSVNQILATHQGDKSYPFLLRDKLGRELRFIWRRFPSHEAYAGQPITRVLSETQRERATVRHVYTFSTSYIENQGDGSFSVHPLPFWAQLSPVYALLAGDFNGDGHTDLLLGGNLYAVKPRLGRMDASYGLFLKGDGAGAFTPVLAKESGFFAPGQVRALRFIDTRDGRRIVVAKNGAAVQFFDAR